MGDQQQGGDERTTPPAFRDPEVIHALVNDAAVLFASLTGFGTISWISDSALPLLGWDPATIAERNAVELVHPDDQELLIDLLAESVRGSADRSTAVLRLRHDAGRWCAFEFAGVDLREEDGEGTYLVWGRPFEHVTRLLSFLDTLLADTDLPRIIEHVIAWLDTLILESASAVLIRDADGVLRCVATSASLPPELALEGPSSAAALPAVAPGRPGATRGGDIDVDLDRLPPSIRDVARAAGYEACWAVPVPDADGDDPVATIVTWRRRPGPTSVTQRRRLDSGAQVVRLAVEWARTQEQLFAAATTDALTGLANRAQFEARVAGERTPLAAVLLIDLDDFKAVNDQHGHLMGDELLRECARRMSAVVRGSDVLARLGGDEFAVWCPHLSDARTGEALAGRILEALAEPVDLDGVAHPIGCSIGVALVATEDPADRDLDQILGAADQALYRAKAAGKSGWAS